MNIDLLHYLDTFPLLDNAMKGLYVDSDGKLANYPCYYRKAEDKLHKSSAAIVQQY